MSTAPLYIKTKEQWVSLTSVGGPHRTPLMRKKTDFIRRFVCLRADTELK